MRPKRAVPLRASTTVKSLHKGILLGLGCGCGQPLSMSLIYALSPRGRVSESTGLRVTVNNYGHLVIPLAFGSVGTVFGFFPVFV